jgi:hypothetical protein
MMEPYAVRGRYPDKANWHKAVSITNNKPNEGAAAAQLKSAGDGASI